MAKNAEISNSEISKDIPQEAEYTAKEFATAGISLFGKDTSPDCITAAFKLAGVDKTTKSTAIKIVKEFMKKEVK